jgi:membrane-bound lytic murein transglycosylase B
MHSPPLELDHSQKFYLWLGEFSAIARKDGIDETTLHIAFDNAHFIPGIIELDRA